MRTKPPCKKDGVDCTKRHVGCQPECDAFIKWQAVHAQEKAAQWLYYAGANDADARTKDRLVKMGKRYQRKRRVGQP
jgi:hypothetical protein